MMPGSESVSADFIRFRISSGEWERPIWEFAGPDLDILDLGLVRDMIRFAGAFRRR